MKMKRCAAGISLLCLMTLSGCIPAPTSPPRRLFTLAVRRSAVALPGSNPKTNGDLSAYIFNLERALASCALQVETVKKCQEELDVKAEKSAPSAL